MAEPPPKSTTRPPELDLDLVRVKTNRPQTLGDKRNEIRLTRANANDARMLSKYLPAHMHQIMPQPALGPDDHFAPPPNFLPRLKQVALTPVPAPKHPTLIFATTPQALSHNARQLANAGHDLSQLLDRNRETTLHFGSEFRPIHQLEMVLGGHPLFSQLRTILTEGMDYRFKTELSESDRLIELTQMLERGNHKSSDAEPDIVNKLLLKDVTHGFSIPLPPDTVPLIVGALVQPFGLAQQFTLTELGDRVVKYRLTQDLSFSLSQEKCSVNSRIDMTKYNEMIYGWCLSRLLHYIIALRLAYPDQSILISKYDYSDAYRRMVHAGPAAAQSIAVFDNIAYVALRLTFGGSPNPPTWCLFSEMVTDLANEIAICNEWDPETLRSPEQPITPLPKLDTTHGSDFAIAQATAVSVPVTSTIKTDGFIDDLILVFLDTPKNRARAPHCVPLAVHATSRPHAGPHEPLPRRNILGDAKLLAEGTPDELQIVLGWTLRTRQLIIALPDDKFDAWSRDIQTMLTIQKATFGDLQTCVGRLNHTAFVIPLARHFLSRLRDRVEIKRHKTQSLTLSSEEIQDLHLWVRFLTTANLGISMNRVTIRQPTRLCISDACPWGIAGYSLNGRAWRIVIPHCTPLRGDSRFNNLFEFIGTTVTAWLECLDSETHAEECILALGDNTSALGWIYRSSRVKPTSMSYKAIQKVARHLATVFLDSTHCLASQHLKGDHNVVADLLSFAGHDRDKPHPLAADNPSDQILTQRFHEFLPSQIPANFAISPLPPELLSWTSQVLQIAESSLIHATRAQMRQTTGSGVDGFPFANTQASLLTPTSLLYSTTKANSSSEPSWACTGMPPGTSTVDLPGVVARQWSQALCALPQAVWLRRSGTISNTAPFTSRKAPTCDLPCVPSSVHTTTRTQHPNAKKPLPPSCCDTCSNPQALPPLPSVTLLPP
jgi:hypothetical protein